MSIEGFKTAAGKNLTKERLINEIKDFIFKDNRYQYKILVGTDSENFDKGIEFISVIVVHRVGYGARYFWKRIYSNKKDDLYSRLWKEAIYSLDISKELLRFLIKEKLNFQFEVHLDLGTNGKSKSIIKELVNLIKGHGFDVKIKPEAYAASKIADHLL
ncbi:MAG: ribonuclease H-like YkuK family protein [Minisyncoccia bacterium]